MSGTPQIEAFKKLLTDAGLPELGPGPRPGVLPQAKLDAALAPLFRSAGLPGPTEALVRGLILLWHDHLDPAHAIVQDATNADGSLLHAILHRREPDYGNAAYWFRRVGRHPVFPKLAQSVAVLLQAQGQDAFQIKLRPGGNWDPFNFIKLCEQSARGGGEVQLLREIQGLESEVLLEHWLG